MGVKNAMPVDRGRVSTIYIRHAEAPVRPRTRSGARPGSVSNQIVLNEWAIAAGGHARTGLEDNVRLDRERLAPSNAALVRRAADLCARHDRPVATWQQARGLLGLRAPA
jgi:3-keto-5-aminohexanoate cleavage enzyme